MIATLRGVVAEKLGEVVVIDAGGVGYGVLVPLEDYGRLNTGEETKVYVYEHIRENSHDLYGFTRIDTKQLFEKLLDVNGIGPKGALSILGIGSAESVRQAIAGGDTKFIQQAQGVGKRVAERIVVELKDKVGLISTFNTNSLMIGSAAVQGDEAVQALISLGYSPADAMNAMSTIDTALSTEARVKLALKGTSR